jgi:hypothetical protein
LAGRLELKKIGVDIQEIDWRAARRVLIFVATGSWAVWRRKEFAAWSQGCLVTGKRASAKKGRGTEMRSPIMKFGVLHNGYREHRKGDLLRQFREPGSFSLVVAKCQQHADFARRI